VPFWERFPAATNNGAEHSETSEGPRALSLCWCFGSYIAIWFPLSSDGNFITESVIQQSR
jgi:hypothetical protein